MHQHSTSYAPCLIAACEIADFLIGEGLVPAALAGVAPPLIPAPLAAEMAAVQEAARPMCVLTASSHNVPGGQLHFQPQSCGNDRIGVVPLERWDVEEAPLDNPAGTYC